jgi:hypothetical protein
VNKYKVAYNNEDINLNLIVNNDFELGNRSDGYASFETNIIKDVINPEIDFEVNRFSHNVHSNNLTKIYYNFLFKNQTNNTYFNSYVNSNLFSVNECYYNVNSFSKSFFKLDFYDTNNSSTQKNYLTIILPTQQGLTESFILGNIGNVDIRKPLFSLDFIGDKEGFFIYWLKKTEYLDIDTFYMSAKFFDAKNGIFIRMVNSELITSNFNPDDYFYYKVKLDYVNNTYEVYNINDANMLDRVGLSVSNSIKWYEYNG